jgi:deoxycytidylate deaminase
MGCPEKIAKLGIKRLEYCQALHAEENAIIQGAKIGGMGLQGAKIYTTTFPCELCAKKIQQVGIDEIVYTEPYPGNISEQIYLRSHFKQIDTKQFEGIMPRGYFKLFKVAEDQKEWQDLRSREFVD